MALPTRSQPDWDDELNNHINGLDANVQAAAAQAAVAASDAAYARNRADEVHTAVLGGTDAAVAGFIDDDTSATKVALSNAFDSPALVAKRVAEKMTGTKLVVVFRHDDPQTSTINYLPVYEAHGVKGTWFAAPSRLGQDVGGGKVYSSEADILAIHAAGHEIGNHTDFETTFLTPTALTEAQRRAAILDGKKNLENLIGGGYICETFAYPGNQVVDTEILDYHILATKDSGPVRIVGDQDFKAYPATYYSDLVDDASLAATTTKTQTQVAAWKAAIGGTVAVIQAHNETEMTADQLDAILAVLTADPEVVVLTMREWAHYVMHYYSRRGRGVYAHPSVTDGKSSIRFSSSVAADSGVAVDRIGSAGAAFRAKVNGTEVSMLDNRLVMKDGASDSNMEVGHGLQFFTPSNGKWVKFKGDAADVLAVTGTMQIRVDPAVFFRGAVYQDRIAQTLAANGAAAAFDATAGTMFMVTLQANATSSQITNTNLSSGQEITITWIQDATGGRTYSWPSVCRFAGGAAPSDTTPNTRTSVTFICYDAARWHEKARAVAVPNT